MTYIEWKTELKNNLLSVSEAERQRVLDYYAEAYADRRDAGMSEKKIIEEFGAPYDAARRILSESEGVDYGAESTEPFTPTEERVPEKAKPYDGARKSEPAKANETRGDYTWVFVLLCVLFAFPLFVLIMAMVGVTIGFCVAPVGIIIAGGAVGGASIAAMIIGGAGALPFLGAGIMVMGIGIALAPLFFKLVGLMWKGFTKLFGWIKKMFSGKGAK